MTEEHHHKKHHHLRPGDVYRLRDDLDAASEERSAISDQPSALELVGDSPAPEMDAVLRSGGIGDIVFRTR